MRTCSLSGQHNRAHLVWVMRTPIDVRGLDFISDQLLRCADLFECVAQPVRGIGITLGIKKQETHRFVFVLKHLDRIYPETRRGVDRQVPPKIDRNGVNYIDHLKCPAFHGR